MSFLNDSVCVEGVKVSLIWIEKQLSVKMDMTVIWLSETATDALMREPSLHIPLVEWTKFLAFAKDQSLMSGQWPWDWRVVSGEWRGDAGLTRIDDHSLSWSQGVSPGGQAHTRVPGIWKEASVDTFIQLSLYKRLYRRPRHFLCPEVEQWSLS